MPMREALRRCPDASASTAHVALPVGVAQIFAVFAEYTPLVEGLSLDEAFLDVTASMAASTARDIAVAIKRRILELHVTCPSVGVAPNKLVAKIASELEKPDGLVIVAPGEVNALLDPLPLRRLFGLGPKTAPRVEALGIRTLGELRAANPDLLRPVFGRYAERVQQRAAGIDDRPVVPDLEEVQISTEETFVRNRRHSQLRSYCSGSRTAARPAARTRPLRLVRDVKIGARFHHLPRQPAIEPPTRKPLIPRRGRAARCLARDPAHLRARLLGWG